MTLAPEDVETLRRMATGAWLHVTAFGCYTRRTNTDERVGVTRATKRRLEEAHCIAMTHHNTYTITALGRTMTGLT